MTPDNINFNAQHSPMGAFMSFTCGHHGSRGGVGVQIGKPANQDLYIGVKDGDRFSDAPLHCLPFFKAAKAPSAAADFQVEQAGPAEQAAAPKVIAFGTDAIRRRYGWATDRWEAGDLTFTIYSPFGSIPDPDEGEHTTFAAAIRPAIRASLRLDNRAGAAPRTLVFAIHFDTAGARLLNGKLAGNVAAFGHRREIGVAGRVRRERTVNGKRILSTKRPEPVQGFNVSDAVAKQTPHPLGSSVGLVFTVAAGESAELELAIGCYLDGIVTTGIDTRYAYTRHHPSLEHVLTDALAGEVASSCKELDDQLAESGLSVEQQFLIAHATRSYYGSTQLLDVGGRPFWVVNEGEYCMMNTLDLTVDHVFWELRQNPWVVRNQLDHFVRHYSYVDELKPADVEPGTPMRRAEDHRPGGLSFCHDMGAHNNFSPPGTSSYELPGLTGCFSYMTAEQLCNWILTAACYVGKTNDDAWLRHNASTIRACLDSLNARCGDAGFVQYDSMRCGEGGAEITTYDSLDHSLAQARNNVYMAVKCWASYHVLSMLLGAAGMEDAATDAYGAAVRGATRIANAIGDDDVFPAVFEPDSPGYHSRILPAIEGLLYVHTLAGTELDGGGSREVTWDAYGPMLDALKRHTRALLSDPQRRNLFADGGIKLSSTSNNSWMSKIALFQHVCREVFELDDDDAIRTLFAHADAAHAKWQIDGSGYWACSDQFVSGIAKGSRYYPRIITAALWLEGRRLPAPRDAAAALAQLDGGRHSNGDGSP